jgi:uncharacterized membrane protein
MLSNGDSGAVSRWFSAVALIQGLVLLGVGFFGSLFFRGGDGGGNFGVKPLRPCFGCWLIVFIFVMGRF